MHRITALLFALTLTACQSTRPPPIASGPTLIQGFDANGNATLTSYAGRSTISCGMTSWRNGAMPARHGIRRSSACVWASILGRS